MESERIYREVVDTAERFGPGNPQEFRLLSAKLARCDGKHVLDGLLLVFSRSVAGHENYPKQELAGRLLAKAQPKTWVPLAQALRAVLPAYDPSIEQLPYYLASVVGRDAVISELLKVESEELDGRTHAAARTMRW